MSIKSIKQLPTARRFGIGWMAISLLGAVGVGLVGITFVNSGGLELKIQKRYSF